MRKLLKILNPFIAVINFFMYQAHLETFVHTSAAYEPYDFTKDLKYF